MSRASYEESTTLSAAGDRLQQELAMHAEDLTRSLETFLKQRSEVIEHQKQAMANYEDEMLAIGNYTNDLDDDMNYGEHIDFQQVDHNVMRHLNIVKTGDEYGNDEDDQYTEQQSTHTGGKSKRQPTITSEKPRELSMEQKKNVRNRMFNFLDEARLEEMRLEIELERAEIAEDDQLVKELREASYLLQKKNCQQVRDMVQEYNPSSHGKLWGNDPEYLKMLKHLNSVGETSTRKSKK